MTAGYPAGRRGVERDDEAKLTALRKLLLGQLRGLRTGEDWVAWLRLGAQLRNQGFANILLIAAQHPDATMVATYEQWQALGRRIRRGEHGIRVLVDDGDAKSSFVRRRGAGATGREAVQENSSPQPHAPRLTYLWDVSQTTGSHRRSAAQAGPRSLPPGIWDVLTWLARREGFVVECEECGRGDGVTLWAARRIRVRPAPTGAALAALAHELGHVLLHRPPRCAPGASTSGCRGIQKVEADSVAFTVCRRLGIDPGYSFPYVANWAGGDQRAQPEAAVLAAGERIVAASGRISRHIEAALPDLVVPEVAANPVRGLATLTGVAPEPATSLGRHTEISPTATVGAPADDGGWVGQVLADAERFFAGELATSWVPSYLRSRRLPDWVAQQWRVGYAAAGWNALTSHLRRLGHGDDAIVAAGLARRSANGTLIDHFRDRVMLAILDEHGSVAGFIGRAHPRARPAVPKYLNSPETVVYKKGELLFGLYEARDALAHGAVPVITEGPFDAIAVTVAGEGRYAGIAPCGTALTPKQVDSLGRFADLAETGILVALDGDRAGRDAALKAYDVLRGATGKTAAVILSNSRDPAEMLRSDGPLALASALREHVQSLATFVVDARLDRWRDRLGDSVGQLFAMRDVAALIAHTMPPDIAERVVQITGGRVLQTLDDALRPRAYQELAEIASVMPPEVVSQVVQLAERLGIEDYSEVVAEVANAVIKEASAPKGPVRRRDDELQEGGPIAVDACPSHVTSASFPASPPAAADSPRWLEAPTSHVVRPRRTICR